MKVGMAVVVALVGMLASDVVLADGKLVEVCQQAAKAMENLNGSNASITMIVSVVGGVVGFIALTVAWAQMRIASAKVRLDLYNKRFEVYKAALDYHHAIWFGDHSDVKEVGNSFIKYFRESKFLFKEKGGIYKTLEKMKDSGQTVRGSMEQDLLRLNGGHELADQMGPLNEASAKARDGFSDLLTQLENQMASYINFRNASGWTFFKKK